MTEAERLSAAACCEAGHALDVRTQDNHMELEADAPWGH